MASTNPGHSISIDGAPEAIFACVYKTYKANLPQDIQADLAKFHDTKSMIKEIDDLAKDSLSRPSKIRKPLQMIANIAHALEPYFEVVGIYVQTNPEYAGLVWGTLRFIFMMATNYTTFAAKIENALFRIASALPNFESLLNRLRRSENDDVKEIIPRFAKALAYIYSDILEFCHRICMLLNPRGKGPF
ncbi:hypothetical protein P171DRAFT_9664 [Karstenula rhodostoma CBS 690.94]|uniref:DUF7708 domain-containing protein n=1 Tax=Karstenula rhodostoma CBS 690.94 TaxID=1392251 RepID=A0A9P4PYP3_9PLEO|nr:hypothetical protein P171DRAFT_9664 [Karstenula rhodostoma CBS 690.94]